MLADDFDMDFRVSLMELFQIRKQEVAAGGFTGPDTQLPPFQGMGFQEAAFPLADQVHGRFNMFEQKFPFGSQVYLFGVAGKQRVV